MAFVAEASSSFVVDFWLPVIWHCFAIFGIWTSALRLCEVAWQLADYLVEEDAVTDASESEAHASDEEEELEACQPIADELATVSRGSTLRIGRTNTPPRRLPRRSSQQIAAAATRLLSFD
eukprot:TRINITY_DN16071_c0_g1_i1.p2 TRINITY_DN16071_c0_g1~~TRINITY_DN16071_c0_g1_i1.p2  ORF type:complete len:121 (+),score=21.27 TRINITY_DN16071_c0_g1_i1:56-418(+)